MKLKYYFKINQTKEKDMNHEPFELIITAVDEKYSSIDDDGTYDINEIGNKIINIKPKKLEICGFTQIEFEYLIPLVSDYVESLSIFKCQKIKDFKNIELLDKLLYLNIYWNTKVISLWNVGKKLKKLKIMDCNKMTDFSGLSNSQLKSLELYGSNGLSSFTSKLVINDLNYVFELKSLEYLGLDVVKNLEDYDFLLGLSKMKNLKQLYLPNKTFTFEQYAWLKSKLNNTNGLEAYRFFDFDDTYEIIGKGKPKNLKDGNKAKLFENEYEQLVLKYADMDVPPKEN